MPGILWHTLKIPHCFLFLCGHRGLALSHTHSHTHTHTHVGLQTKFNLLPETFDCGIIVKLFSVPHARSDWSIHTVWCLKVCVWFVEVASPKYILVLTIQGCTQAHTLPYCPPYLPLGLYSESRLWKQPLFPSLLLRPPLRRQRTHAVCFLDVQYNRRLDLVNNFFSS